MKKKNKISFYINISIVLLAILFEMLAFSELSINISNNIFKTLFICLIIVVDILIALIIYIFKKKDICLEKKYLIIGLIIGGMYLLSIPMMKGTDEIPHFFRIYRLSQGEIVVENKEFITMPKKIFEYADPNDLKFYSKDALTTDYGEVGTFEMQKVNNNSANSTPLQYIPQTLGYFIAQILQLPPFFMFYMVRLFNFTFWIIASYFALKRMPIKKEFMMILFLAPSILSLMSTMTGDSVLNASAFLFISIVIDIYYNKKDLILKDALTLFALAIIISSIKTVYFPILFLLLLINKKQFKEIKIGKVGFIALMVLISVSINMIWSTLISSTSADLLGDNLSKLQLEFILSNPLQYLLIFFKEFTNEFFYYITNIVAGAEMCLTTANINQILVIGYFSVLVISYFYDKRDLKLNGYIKLIIWFIFLLITGAIASVMYVAHTSMHLGIGVNDIIGIQSRYFIILVPILMLTLPNLKKNMVFKDKNTLFYLCILFNGLIFIDTIGSLISFYAGLL